MSPSKARANAFERTPTKNGIFDSDHLQNERERLDMKRKHMNTDET